MALSFEESKKLLAEQMAAQAPARMSLRSMAVASEGGNWQKPKNASFYEYYDNEYHDDKLSIVDENKNITLSADQINITQEKNSQYIPFEIPRYYDGFDLTTTELSIYWVNKLGNGGPAIPVDVYYNEDKIRFAWLVDDKVTALAGKIQFEIQASGTNSKGYSYLWKTKSSDGINVLQALEIKGFIEPDETWQDSFIQRISQQADRAEAAAANAQAYADEAKRVALELQDGIAQEVQTALGENYYTKPEVDEALDNVQVDLTGYATEQYVQDEIEKVDVSDQLPKNLSDLAEDATHRLVTDVEKQTWNNKSDFSGSYNDLTDAPTKVSAFENDSGYLTEHQDLSDYALKTEIPSIEGLATEEHVRQEIEKIDVSDQLINYALKDEIPSIEGLATETYVQEAVDAVDVSEQLKDYATQTYVQEEISKVDISDQLSDYAKSENVYTKTDIDTKTDVLSSSISTNASSISSINSAIQTINETIGSIDKSPNAYYVTTYNEPYTVEGTEYTGENTLVLYKTDEADNAESRSVVSTHVITGGSGGSSSSNIIKIERITTSPFVVTANDDVVIEYNFIGTDASGDDIGQGNATWKLGNQVIKTEKIYTGENIVNLTEYISVGSDQKITLIISDDIGTIQQKTWYVSVVDVKLESTFDDTKKYTANEAVSFTFTPYGAVDKTLHFLLDGEEIATKTSAKSAAGLSDSYMIPAQPHGTHLFEIYMTATINGNDIESNHIVKDVIWYDEESNLAVIGSVQQKFTARQYATTNIVVTVYDPSTETPSVSLKATYVNENGDVVEEYGSNQTLTSNTFVWSYKTDVVGEHTLTITCGEVTKTLIATIVELGINVTPTTAGLEFDFNPVGYSNNDENRVWKYGDTGIGMTLSDNFDWVNGGYQLDENGDQYFGVKAGTYAIINYNLFADDAKDVGKEFKVIFKTTNVKKRDTSFISCMNNGIGIDMKVESANIYSSNDRLYSPYCEEDIIEFEFNINKSSDIPLVLTYEDGVGNRPMIYTSDSSFWQTSPQPITIGSDDCDVRIYRMKAYSSSLSDKDILNNFIADARNAEEMINRHDRNQIYKEGKLDPEYLAEVCPDLRIIMLDTPWFTNDKDNKINDTNVTMIYKNGDPILDNWTCTGAQHRGQGTSSNEYGYSSRNIDLVMDTDTSLFTLGDGKTTSSTITLTRNSVPTDYLNVKVNVASSENENNAQHARRYNEFNPFVRAAKFNDKNVKDCMEFYNCVVFLRERNEDISTHREFLDTEWHYYSLGNVGDSKKTDDTRVNNKRDPKECVVEITDYNVPLAEFPTGVDGICPIAEWKAGNVAYDHLYTEYEYEDGEFKSFGNKSYEFRYEMKNITEEQRQANIDTWRDMYKFVVTSTDAEFYSKLKEYFVVDSALYFYLYTERYTMVDNRAKNSFWHYGKVYISEAEAATLGDAAGGYVIDNTQAAIREGYRWDLSFFYDADTSLGIDNTGKLVLTYGKEDTDYYVDGDPSSSYIYRAAESTFFRRLYKEFASELQAMFVDREDKNAWSAEGLIKQWDDAQSQFPEEIWRLDIQRKYLRTYLGISVDNSKPGEANPRFLVEMLNGRKKYQRRMFERNQELYMATKYFGKTATQDQIMMRFNNPVGSIVEKDFTLYLTPYSDMYIGVKFGNVTPTNFRAKAGVEYTIPYAIDADTADITLIYGASFIQAIGDLSKCYVGDNDFSKASRLQSLSIGSDVEGYSNNFMTKISLGNNKLLEYLDIRNITSLNSVVDLSQCHNLLELRAEGSNASGVIFANGGKIQKAYIPAITSLTMKNLNYIEEFVIESYDKLQTLIVEYTPFINTYDVVNAASVLQTLRLIGINWSIDNTSVLERVLGMRGINNTGGEVLQSVLTGTTHIPTIKEKTLADYNNAWPDLDITYNTLVPQFSVTFVNYDGTVLDVQYVDKGTAAIDPTTRVDNPINTPTKESSVSTDYTFAGWDKALVNAFENQVITATYSESLRQYTVKYVVAQTNNVLQETTAPYGSTILYTGEIPTYTVEESGYRYYLFDGWDKSGYVNGDKIINAVYDSCEYTEGYFVGKDISKLRPVEIYMMLKLSAAGHISLIDYVESKDAISIQLGNDFSYEDVQEQVLISEKTVFDGSNCVDTGINLLSKDRDFVLAIDCKIDSTNSNNAVLAQCFSGLDTSGFRLQYNSGVKFIWGTSSATPFNANTREMIVIRHVKGENGVHIYSSRVSNTSSYYVELAGNHSMIHDVSLVFGCSKLEDGSYEQHATGTIYWSKIWYADLGDNACSQIAYWPHEEMTFEACYENNGTLKRYYLSDNSGSRSSITFIAKTPLPQPVVMHTVTDNGGGWASYYLNRYLNSRVYEAFPTVWKQLMKQVKVKSSIGNKSNELSSSDCYIFVPSVSEMDPNITHEPYGSEGTIIKHFSSNATRILRTLDGNVVQYWTRSPSTGYDAYVYRIDSSGNSQPITQMNTSNVYARIMISI